MRILFAMSSPEYLRYYDATIAGLAARGHDVAIAVNAIRDGKPVRFDGFAGGRISIAGLIPPRDDIWTELARSVRGTMDFLRFLHPRLASAPALRARMKRQGLPLALQWVDRIRSIEAPTLRRLMNALSAAERAIPVAPPIARFLDVHQPDLLLVSPLVEAASIQVDLVRAAQARGSRVATCIASWDNLTNKGDLRVATDLIVVWNEAQKREAIEFHRVPPEKVAVTGSQVFDRWFDRQPSRSREDFCDMVGLPAAKPFVTFMGSSIFISRADVEVPFVRRWIQALREATDPAVRDISVLIRPHPYNGAQWADRDLSGLGDVAVWPRGKHNPVDDINRADFFDTMYHCAAVVGINTSAMIESAIVGRPVLSILTPEFAGSQDGTLHFHHLLPENGGFLRIASSLGEHVRQLGEILRAPEAAREQLARFVASFIRPHGVDRAATPILVEALERFGQSPPPPPLTESFGVQVLRLMLLPLAAATRLLPDEALRKGRPMRRLRELWLRFARNSQRIVRRWAIRPAQRTVRWFTRLTRRGRARVNTWIQSTFVRRARRAARFSKQARYHLRVTARRIRGLPLR